MQSVSELLAIATSKLASVTDTPRLDAEVLLAFVTGKSRTFFRAWPEQALAAGVMSDFVQLLEHRLAGHPIAYLTGTREFWSREFLVTPDVLIPRPETESLVELALRFVSTGHAAAIVDLGTGSGAIAVSLALALPIASITAVDISPVALQIAAKNATRLGAGNIRFIRSDWFSALPTTERFDLIVSNPPYIAENDPHLRQGDIRFEPNVALASGPDGFDAIRKIVKAAPKFLKAGGWLLFEHGYDQSARSRRLLQESGFEEVKSFPDLQGHERVSGGRMG